MPVQLREIFFVHSCYNVLCFQMIWFRENWYEELLRQLNEGLSLCQAAAFASRADGRLINNNMKFLND